MIKQHDHGSRFVAALPTRVEIVEAPPPQLPAVPIAPPMPYSSHVDRAKGFSLATAPLAGVAGLVAALVGVSAFGVPALSVAALLLALAGFCVVWLAAFVAHLFISADGALFLHTVFAWAYLNREAKERRKRYAQHH